jgi:hypothetical protein
MDIHTLDMFFRCRVSDTSSATAMDDAEEALWIPVNELHPDEFGLRSVREGLIRFLEREARNLGNPR